MLQKVPKKTGSPIMTGIKAVLVMETALFAGMYYTWLKLKDEPGQGPSQKVCNVPKYEHKWIF